MHRFKDRHKGQTAFICGSGWGLKDIYKNNPEIPLFTVAKVDIGIPKIKNIWV